MRGPDLCVTRTEKGPNGGVVEKSLRAVIRLGAVGFGLGASGKVRGLPWERAGGAGEAVPGRGREAGDQGPREGQDQGDGVHPYCY